MHVLTMAENLNEALECCICNETDPRSLPCSHTLCSKCLVDDVNARSTNGTYSCPVCRQDMVIPAGGILQLCSNVKMEGLPDEHLAEYPCAFGHANPPATAVCITCQGKRLCQSCKEHHRLHPAHHDIVDAEEFPQGRHQSETVQSQPSSICKDHEENYTGYCRECKQLLCAACYIVSESDSCKHGQDSRCPIDEASEKAKEVLLSKLKDVESQITELSNQREKFCRNDQVSKMSFLQVKASLSDYYDAVNTEVQKRKDALIQEVDKEHMERKAIRDKFRYDMNKKIEALESLKQKIERIEECEPTETLMHNQELLEELEFMTIHDLRDVPNPFVQRFVAQRHTPDEITNILTPLADIEFDGKCLRVIDTQISGDKRVSCITGLGVFPDNDVVCVDSKNGKVKRYTNQGMYKGVMKAYNAPENPWGCASSPDGTVIVGGSACDNICIFRAGIDENVSSQRVNPKHTSSAGLLAVASTNGFMIMDNQYTPRSVSIMRRYNTLMCKPHDDTGDILFEEPMFMVCNSRKEIIISDRTLDTVFIFNEKVKLITQYKEDLKYPQGVCVDEEDNIYIADTYNDRVISLSPEGVFRRVVLSKENGLKYPRALTFDNQRHLLVSCSGEKGKHHLIKVYSIRTESHEDGAN